MKHFGIIKKEVEFYQPLRLEPAGMGDRQFPVGTPVLIYCRDTDGDMRLRVAEDQSWLSSGWVHPGAVRVLGPLEVLALELLEDA